MSTHASSNSRMLGLDGIRAMAVIGVVWHHAHPGFGALPMSRNGFLGVDAFFVLSGFLITVLLLREQAAHGSISLRQFYVRRALRIFPLYYAVLALLALYFLTVKHSTQGQAFLQALPYHLTFLSNWVPVDSLMAITWSLSSEEQFYLLWPPLLVWLGVRRALPLLIGFLLLNQAVNFGWLDAVFAGNGVALSHLEILQTTSRPSCWVFCWLSSWPRRRARTGFASGCPLQSPGRWRSPCCCWPTGHRRCKGCHACSSTS